MIVLNNQQSNPTKCENHPSTHIALDLHQLVVQLPPSGIRGGHRILQDGDLAKQIVDHVPLTGLAQHFLEGSKLSWTARGRPSFK